MQPMKPFLMTLMVLTYASPGMAQEQGGRGGRGGVLGLLAIAEVQSELAMTDSQKESFRAIRGEERRQRNEEIAKKADEAVKTVLDEKQQQRLAELRLQRDGGSSLARADVAEKLMLDQAQKDQIKKIQADNPAPPRPDRNASQADRDSFRTAAREQREKLNTALLAVLTPAQKEAFEKMQGAKFAFPPPGRRNQQTR
jgi:hypothetical protein